MISERYGNRLQDNGRRFDPAQDQRFSSVTEKPADYFKRGGVAHIQTRADTALCGSVTGVATLRKYANCIHCFRVRKLRKEGKPITNRDCNGGAA